MKSGEEIPDEVWDVIQCCLNIPSLRPPMSAVCALLSFVNSQPVNMADIDGQTAIEYLVHQARCLVSST